MTDELTETENEQEKSIMHPIFEECCGGLYPKPFVINNFLYATDGRIAVRVQVEDRGQKDQKNFYPNYPNISTVFTSNDFDKESVVLPTFTITYKPCYRCEGTGRQNNACPYCDGFGEVECDMGYEHDCDLCMGSGIKMESCPECKNNTEKRKSCHVCNHTGFVKMKSGLCEECKGKKKIPQPVFIPLDNTYGINTLYAATLRKYKAQVFLPTSRKGALKFTVGKIEGRLMCMQNTRD